MGIKIINYFLPLVLIFGFSGLIASENSTELYNKGADLAKKGRYDEAIVVFKSVIKKNPYYTLGHYGLGKCYLYKKDKLEKSIKHLGISVNLDREFSKGFFYLGFGYFFLKKYPRAITSFNKAFRLDRTGIESLYNISIIYELMGHSARAKIFFTKYRKMKIKLSEDRIF